MKVALDTSCLIPLLCKWHAVHEETQAVCNDLRGRNTPIIIPAHALLECYSVLTRMPARYRFLPSQAYEILLDNFSQDVEIAPNTPAMVWSVLGELSRRGLGGGLTYDAAIARTVREAGATLLLTWNLAHFLGVAPPGLEIREPRLPLLTT